MMAAKGVHVLAIVLVLFVTESAVVNSLGPDVPGGLLIPGTSIRGRRGERALRSLLDCQSGDGRWTKRYARRRLPWVRSTYGFPNECDKEKDLQFKKGLLVGLKADRVSEIPRGNWSVPPGVLWEWASRSCPLEEFSYNKFCRTMKNLFGWESGILVIGGDVAWAFERRFFYNMMAAGPRNPVVVNLFPKGCKEWHTKVSSHKYCSGYRYCFEILNGNSVPVRFIRNPILASTRWINGVLAPWLGMTETWRPKVIVINHSEPNVTLELFRLRVSAMVEEIHQNTEANRLVVYIATPLAPDCYFLRNFKEDEPFDVELYRQQNLAAKRIMMRSRGLYLDINAPIESMPETYKEEVIAMASREPKDGCIDTCMNGPTDAWPHLFYNLLMKAFQGRPRNFGDVADESEDFDFPDNKTEEVPEVLHIENVLFKPLKVRPQFSGFIPGTKVTSLAQAKEIKALLQCHALRGKWVYNDEPRAIPWPIAPLRLCDVKYAKQGEGRLAYHDADVAARDGEPEWKVRDAILWEWRTKETCPLERFTHESFCRLLGPKRRILIAGDSLNRNFYETLVNNLVMGTYPLGKRHLPFHDEPIGEFDLGTKIGACRKATLCEDVLGADEGVVLHYCQSNRLALTRVPIEGHVPWALKLNTWNPSIVILNTGAHYRADEILDKNVRDTLYYVRKRLPNALIVWRNTVPGHINCTQYPAPLKKRQDPKTLPKDWGWGEFKRQNEMVEVWVKKIGAVYLNVEPSTALRADGHLGDTGSFVDCLHFCQPGPLDNWVVLLYNALKQLL
eukprot:TRINITY_DN10194_c0_g12_i1.p1 TRINITY_DN10194_c0_g12~~TRINITY_DN10194_c0_g12_i1.p1  ORF type:complete len:789 (+),score=38.59 TRINITY_DN10194_c0_g12_i1:972-3338(+)